MSAFLCEKKKEKHLSFFPNCTQAKCIVHHISDKMHFVGWTCITVCPNFSNGHLHNSTQLSHRTKGINYLSKMSFLKYQGFVVAFQSKNTIMKGNVLLSMSILKHNINVLLNNVGRQF